MARLYCRVMLRKRRNDMRKLLARIAYDDTYEWAEPSIYRQTFLLPASMTAIILKYRFYNIDSDAAS